MRRASSCVCVRSVHVYCVYVFLCVYMCVGEWDCVGLRDQVQGFAMTGCPPGQWGGKAHPSTSQTPDAHFTDMPRPPL